MRCKFTGITIATIATVVSGRLREPARGDGGELQVGARRVPRSGSTVSRPRCDGRGDAQFRAATAARGPENHSRRHGENRDPGLDETRHLSFQPISGDLMNGVSSVVC